MDWLNQLLDLRGTEHARTLVLLVVTFAVAWKFAIEHHVGGWHYCQQGTYTRFANDRYAREDLTRRLSPQAYRLGYLSKTIAALALPMGGWVATMAGSILAVWFLLIEPRYDYKHHTIFLGLVCLLIAGTGPAGVAFSAVPVGEHSWLPELLASLLLVQVYLSSAWIKFRTPQFTSGRVLENLFVYLGQQNSRFKRREALVPRALVHHAATRPARRREAAWFASWLTIFVEIAVAGLLVAPGAWLVALVLGSVMHAAFTVVLTVRLIPFSVTVISLYWMVPEWL